MEKSYNFELVATDPTQIYNLGVGRIVAQTEYHNSLGDWGSRVQISALRPNSKAQNQTEFSGRLPRHKSANRPAEVLLHRSCAPARCDPCRECETRSRRRRSDSPQ